MSTALRPLGKMLLPLALSLSLLLGSAAAAQPGTASATTASAAQATTESADDYALFLKEKFDVAFTGPIAKGDFLSAVAKALELEPAESVAFKDVTAANALYPAASALHKAGIITGDTVNAQATLSAVTAAQIALKASGLQELAYTYPAAKADGTLAPFKLSVKKLGLQGAQELAAAIDSGLVAPEYYGLITGRKPADRDYAAVLIGQTLVVKGEYKRFIGYTTDSGIYSELLNAYQTAGIVKAPALQAIGDNALENGLVTGYTIRDSRYESNFIDALSITYGHSDIKHGLQLIALLRSEGIAAKVQFEPRTSAFVYLKEWGEPGVSELYEVRQIANGNYIEYAKEYELLFEFETAADRDRFDGIILNYAKKNEADQKGLLYGSWWQPLYYALDQPGGDYKTITNNKLSDGRYYLESFSLNEKAADVAAAFQTSDSGIAFSTYQFWTNAAFYRYLNGESK